jgi:methylated-DNA-protein-cysteine methyltransferase related protein
MVRWVLRRISYYFIAESRQGGNACKHGPSGVPTSASIRKTDFMYLDAESAHGVAHGRVENMSWEPVYSLVKKIPRGRVTTYGELAKALRLAGGARAIGYALAACPSGRGIPWHRVLGAGGRIRVPEPHAQLQRRLLEAEGVALEGGRVNLARYGWSTAKKRPRARKRSKSAKR